MSKAQRTWRIGGWVAGLGLLAGAAFLAGCGGDSSSMGEPTAVSITITGAPAAPMSPGQGAQLTANAAFADGTVQDVTATATWDTTDPGVLTVSSAGSISAAGPGRADVSATLGGSRDSVSVVVMVLPAAYFRGALEYAFEYQLDANGRVANYRITHKPEIDYGGGPGMNHVFGECQGDLYATYNCYLLLVSNVMRGESGRVVYVSRSLALNGAATYSYGSQGLSGIGASWAGPGSHAGGSTTTALAYNSQGRLAMVEREDRCYDLGGTFGERSIARIAVDAQGRLAHAEYAAETFGSPVSCHITSDVFVPDGVRGPTDWTYDSRGYMIGAGTTSYVVDSDGWLYRRSEGVGTSAKIDTYPIVRVGTRVAEESFTQAEPRAHYGFRELQRVRYEWGRLPSEPLFVPRALTGLNGADYFGIVSSHHR